MQDRCSCMAFILPKSTKEDFYSQGIKANRAQSRRHALQDEQQAEAKRREADKKIVQLL